MSKNKNLNLGSLITVQDIQGWFQDNPLNPSKAQMAFPLIQSDNKTWKTLSNSSLLLNEAADPISLNSKVPVSGRPGYKDVLGEMASFGKGREMTADDIEKFEELKRKFQELKNPAVATQLIDFYGNDLRFVRQAMNAEMAYLSWALISNACNIGFVAANSPYMQGLVAMDYGVDAWQKNNNSTAWSNAASLILDDIDAAILLGKTYSKNFTTITMNETNWGYVRKNTQVQKYCATLVQNLLTTQGPPTLQAVNSMLSSYFNRPLQIQVIDELITRADLHDVKTTACPFSNDVVVFSTQPQLGHFEWNGIPIIDPSRETYESFFLVGNVLEIDPSYSKIYAKGRGFPVVDTYSDNFYLKTNAVAW
jgi:hypothetical protein